MTEVINYRRRLKRRIALRTRSLRVATVSRETKPFALRLLVDMVRIGGKDISAHFVLEELCLKEIERRFTWNIASLKHSSCFTGNIRFKQITVEVLHGVFHVEQSQAAVPILPNS